MTLTRRTILAATAVAALMPGLASAQDTVTLKLHQFLPAQAPVPAGVLVPWMEKITAESGGRIVFEHYPAMQLGGKPGELIDQVTDGVADVVWTLPGYTPGRFPRTEVMELPFLMTDAEAASRTYWTLGEKYMFDTEFQDVKILGMWTHGPGLIHSKTPITVPADLNGVKLRAPTRVTNMMATNLGATAVGMPVPAVPESLSKGVIDATILPWEVTASIKSSELVTNHTEFPGAPLYTSAFILAMNKDVYDGLPDDLKAVIDANSGLEFSANAGKVSQAADAPARQIAVDLGNTIIELTPEQIAEWKDAAEPTIATWVAEMQAQGIDGQALLDEARALMNENTK
ncbi:TRAP transporter substrate-binding protein [Neotabrizicola shimadae]|uniref:TRAP transporter substrate-binding protein n=1 Tax=Neotabrizicola shimadae TaxID=2807096 RepID=A0A8G1ECB1_9RHOB|nr:TRAP transporter substrate-binding protein [Neotabrizicola shimadae]QYZ70242.1 TRAP transporter substrate-binding protein [Neotabrizicola shimadae]